ncbi:MAG: DNA polymerase III subunit alpha [Verrucomicrobiales bacterium]|nr:DNA polymerase III subunit alpha [Verrucomicrobiales bacterium]
MSSTQPNGAAVPAAAGDSFVHLHLHTEYSTLDGAVRISDLMAKAKKLGMPAVAMTDHGNLFGAIEFYQEARKAGVKPIIGCEVYLARGSMLEKQQVAGRKNNSHLTLLAANEQGYHNLVKLVSKAHLDGFYYKPRIDKEQLHVFREGIICLSGCINGEINQFILADQLDQARRSLGEFIDIYGRENFYLEVHNHGMPEQAKSTRQMVAFSKEFGLKLVAANDVHFLDRGDHACHDVMICIGTNALVFDEKRMRYSPEVYFKTPAEMKRLFKELPDAVRNTLEVAEKCSLTLHLDSASSDKYPQYRPPGEKSREAYFRDLCWDGLRHRFGAERAAQDAALRQRLEYEMGVIEKMQFVSYFLITWDFIKWAKDHDIPVGPGRGSAAGSLVAYTLGITDCDPLRFSLIFERFLNPERISPPDVDVDFCQTRRPEVIDYVRKKYGEKSVSQIVTFGTLGARSVIRDVGRVMGMGYGEVDRIARMIPQELNITLADARKKNPDLKDAIERDQAVAKLYETASFLEGLTRGTGVHAAGVVIGDGELDEHIPLTRSNEGEVVSQFAMGPLTDVGMLKMDFLGLKTLTVIKEAEQLIHRHTPNFKVDEVPLTDRATFDLLNRGETCGVFQLESGGMVNLCKSFGVDRVEDIIALIALYRPGPMDLIPDYVERKKGKKKVSYAHPLLEQISSETYGVLIYQEQVMQAANLLAGYTLGGSDMLRRAMGKKKPEEMAKQRKIFVDGCLATNNIPEKKANEIFDLLEKFAGYGFNKSHSAAYGLISYRTAYLKANHPVEFMAALLCYEINNTDKIAVFVNECQSMGIEILPPHVNQSQLKFVPEARAEKPDAIRYGLAAVKGVGEGVVESIIAERTENGIFKSIDDFARRVDNRAMNRKVLESLIKAGAFDFEGASRAGMHARVDQIIAAGASAQRDKASGQMGLFDDSVDFGMPPSFGSASASGRPVAEWSKEEILQHEKDLLGFYVSGHPLDPWRGVIQRGGFERLGELEENKPRLKGKKARFAVFIGEVAVKYTKTGKQFATLRVEDFTGQMEVLVWGEEWERFGKQLTKGSVVELLAKVEPDNRSDSLQLIASGVKALPNPKAGDEHLAASQTSPSVRKSSQGNGGTPASAGHKTGPANPGKTAAPAPRLTSMLRLHIDARRAGLEDLQTIRDILKAHPGGTPVVLCVNKDGHQLDLLAGPRFSVAENDELKRSLQPWLC